MSHPTCTICGKAQAPIHDDGVCYCCRDPRVEPGEQVERIVMYEIVDNHTKARVGTFYNNRARAQRRADRLDQAYGAYRYFVRQAQ